MAGHDLNCTGSAGRFRGSELRPSFRRIRGITGAFDSIIANIPWIPTPVRVVANEPTGRPATRPMLAGEGQIPAQTNGCQQSMQRLTVAASADQWRLELFGGEF
jgi:hypothetical protein